jgi:hypothetical protein
VRGFRTHHLALGQERTTQRLADVLCTHHNLPPTPGTSRPSQALADTHPDEMHPENESRLEGADRAAEAAPGWTAHARDLAGGDLQVFTEEDRETPPESILYGVWLAHCAISDGRQATERGVAPGRRESRSRH